MKWKHAKSLRDLLTILGVQFIVAERHVAQLGSKVLYTILASALVVRPLRRWLTRPLSLLPDLVVATWQGISPLGIFEMVQIFFYSFPTPVFGCLDADSATRFILRHLSGCTRLSLHQFRFCKCSRVLHLFFPNVSSTSSYVTGGSRCLKMKMFVEFC